MPRVTYVEEGGKQDKLDINPCMNAGSNTVMR